MKAQYAILRFAKYKGPEIGHIESHNDCLLYTSHRGHDALYGAQGLRYHAARRHERLV